MGRLYSIVVLQTLKLEGSLDADTISYSRRKEEFRRSNGSSSKFWFDGDGVDSMEHIGPETLRSPQSI